MIMSSQAKKPTEQKLKPKLFSVIKNYSRAQFIKDVVAGVIVAIIALPLSIALALASGVGPEQGLYTAIIAGFIVSFLGGSRVQIAGPTAAFATIVAGIVATAGSEGCGGHKGHQQHEYLLHIIHRSLYINRGC